MPDDAPLSPEPVDLATLARRLRPAMLRLSRLLRREAQKVGISALDAQILGIVQIQPGTGISELADIEQMSRPAMSVHVKRLEATGWLVRAADAPDADRRRVSLTLTDAGERTLAAIRRTRNDWLHARLAHLAPAELAAVSAAIDPLLRIAEMKP
jgi:DNA-binding MarR family transcriptional regulator